MAVAGNTRTPTFTIVEIDAAGNVTSREETITETQPGGWGDPKGVFEASAVTLPEAPLPPVLGFSKPSSEPPLPIAPAEARVLPAEGQAVSVDEVQQILASQIFPQFVTLGQAFNALDLNRDGCVTHDEFSAAMAALGISMPAEAVTQLMRKYDFDGDGKVTYQEFMRSLAVPPPKADTGGHGPLTGLQANAGNSDAIEEMLREKIHGKYSQLSAAFRAIDEDGSGGIDVQEFQKLLAAAHIRIPDHQAQLVLHRYDEDSDGKIELAEFVRMMRPKQYEQWDVAH